MGLFDELKSVFSSQPKSPAFFILSADGKEYGPYQKNEVSQYLSEGRIGWDAQVRQGDEGWRPLSDHPEFPSAAAPPIISKTHQPSIEKPAKPRQQKKKKKEYQPPAADGTIVIEYLNFAGDLKQFIGDPKSIRRRGNHFSVRVAPTFKRISLNRSKTRILKGVVAPSQLPKEPLPVQTTTSDTSIIQYTNWQGENKEFKIITGVVDDKGDFVRVRVSPTFQYITLKRTRIGNPEALFEKTSGDVATETATQPEPPEPVAPAEPASPATGNVSLVLTGCGIGTYDATRIIREMRPDLGTFDIYSLMKDFPQTVAEDINPEKAAAFKKRLEDAGCTVELK
tara:strand:+ start:1558 stop:2574 length:1017 start_codon:yes stop_codon:yes gene_type:complete